jgi:hypothetical protein
MIGIIVDYDVVCIPEPAIAETNIVWSHRKEEATEPEAAGATASEAPDVSAPETAGEVAMLPRMIKVVMSVIAAGIMAHPFSAAVHVRSIGMPFPVAEVAILFGWTRILCARRTVSRNVSTTTTDLRPATTAFVALCQG